MSCLSLLLKLGRTPRGKVSHIFTLEALDVSRPSSHLESCSSSWHLDFALDAFLFHPSCFLILLHQVTTIFMVNLD
jgi:hypothetical protein